MELFFLALLVLSMAGALAVGFPVAFALPGSAILTIGAASIVGFIFTADVILVFLYEATRSELLHFFTAEHW